MKFKSLLALLLIYIAFCTPVLAQVIQISGRAKVLSFTTPFEKIKVDMVDDKKNFIQEMLILKSTVVADPKGKPIAIESIRTGSEIKIKARNTDVGNEIDEIIVITPWLGDGKVIKGHLDHYDRVKDFAVIDGQRVKLSPGTTIKGASLIKGGPFKSFLEISIGNRMEIIGTRKDDGFVYASKATVLENQPGPETVELMNVMGLQFSDKQIAYVQLPPELVSNSNGINVVPSGYIAFGDAQYKIDTSYLLQQYVNSVGSKLVPAYMQARPLTKEGKINFKFFVIDNPIFNAYSLPNGMVFIHTGVLAKLDNEAQLAAVLSHEIAHVMYRHAEERYVQEKKLKDAIKLAYGIADAAKGAAKQGNLTIPNEQTLDMIVMMASQALQGDFGPVVEEAGVLLPIVNKIPPQSKKAVMSLLYGLRGVACNDHGKDNENQSDRVGLFYMQQAGYDPRESSKIWEKFMNAFSAVNLVNSVKTEATEWVSDSKMFSYSNPFQQLEDVVIRKLIDAATDNWFSNYPKASARYRNLNQLTAENYAGEDLSQYKVGVEEFSVVKERAQRVLVSK